jgi:hypothetical protein
LKEEGVVWVFEERLQKAVLNQPPKQAVNYLNVPCTSGSRPVSDIHLRTQARRSNLAASGLPWVVRHILQRFATYRTIFSSRSTEVSTNISKMFTELMLTLNFHTEIL